MNKPVETLVMQGLIFIVKFNIFFSRHPGKWSEAVQRFLDVIKEKHSHASTIISSQLPVEHWHEENGDPIFANAILDHLIHNAHKINLKGGSLRKKYAGLT